MKAEWKSVAIGKDITLSDNAIVKVSIAERVDKKVTGILSIRKWAKYVTKDEKAMGIPLEAVEFRPTNDGISIPVEKLEELLKELKAIQGSV